jgi:hypothetical protein
MSREPRLQYLVTGSVLADWLGQSVAMSADGNRIAVGVLIMADESAQQTDLMEQQIGE